VTKMNRLDLEVKGQGHEKSKYGKKITGSNTQAIRYRFVVAGLND